RRPVGYADLQNRQGRSDRYVVGYEILNHFPNRRAPDVQAPGHVFLRSLRRALAGLLAREELGVDRDAVLQIIDPERRGFTETDHAQVSGDLQTLRMRMFDCSPQLVGLDSHVGFERGDAL